jgi:uncharacterized membrane protein YqiK
MAQRADQRRKPGPPKVTVYAQGPNVTEETGVEYTRVRHRKEGGTMGITLMILLGLLSTGGGLYFKFVQGEPWGGLVSFMLVPGLILLFVGTALGVFTRLWRKTSANQAFVRTGGRGARVILDGGSLVIPFLHELVEVSLETMRLDVKRLGPDALITKDNLRVDIASEFYIRVEPDSKEILQAARSLGERSVSAMAVSKLVFEKLVSALRSVAATKELMELQLKRDEFAQAVQENLAADLRKNGLNLETVTISMLDQTPGENLNPNNVFDAQGLRKITEITQAQNIERNRIDRDAQRAIKDKDVMTRKEVLELERDQAEAEAAQATEVANIQAAKLRERERYEIDQRQQVELAAVAKEETVNKADILKNQMVEMADVIRERAVKTAAVERDQAVQEAEIEKQKAVEVAKRLAEIAVANQETERAKAEAQTRSAEAAREGETQRIETVKVTVTADREAQEKMITEKQQVDIKKYREQTEADVTAYEVAKLAAGELEAAEKQKEAKLILAEAEAEAAKKRATGEQAVQMVPVTVDRERVNIEQARVDVERQELQNKQEFSEAALKFEVQKLDIQADAEVRKAFAESIGNMMSNANMQIFGDPTTLSNMAARFMNAASWGQTVDGLRSTLPPDVEQLASKLFSGTGSALSGAVKKLTGQEVDPAVLEKLVKEALATQLESGNGKTEPAAAPAKTEPKKGGSDTKKA